MENELISKVFKWFGIGLLITFLVAYIVSTNIEMLYFVTKFYPIICILEIVCAIWLSLRVFKMSSQTATTLYLSYAAISGLTFSSIFIVYEITSIIWIFLVTSIIFGIFSFIGKTTKINLNKLSIYLMISLLSVILLEIINIFIMNNTLDLILCGITIFIFIGYVAYDIQKIYRLSLYSNSDNLAIIGAFNIYLDFINLFIKLLRLFGKNKD